MFSRTVPSSSSGSWREVADRLAEAGALVREGVLPVEIDAARRRAPEPDDEPREGGLAGARGADDAEELARLDAKPTLRSSGGSWPGGT